LTANGRSNSSKMRRRANNNFATSRRGCPLAERGEYIPSSRPYQGLPDLEYPFHDRYVLVTALRPDLQLPKEINIPTVLAGQRLGIKEVDEGIWLVSFIDHDLGDIDLEQRTLQPLDNPFGAGVVTYVLSTFCSYVSGPDTRTK